MQITRKCPFTGTTHTQEIPVNELQLTLWREGLVAQRAFPKLTADQREFIMTGITPEEWDKTFNPNPNC